jgi:hypothetical protein
VFISWLLACGLADSLIEPAPSEAAPSEPAPSEPAPSEPAAPREPRKAKADGPRGAARCQKVLLASTAPLSASQPSCHVLGQGVIGEVASAFHLRATSHTDERKADHCTVTLQNEPEMSTTVWDFDVRDGELVPATLTCLVAG